MDALPGRLAALVGRGVSLALVDGTRLDDCQLVSQPRVSRCTHGLDRPRW